jgi:hypothetical protein
VNRVGKKIAEWFLEEAKKTTQEATFELLDIKDFDWVFPRIAT